MTTRLFAVVCVLCAAARDSHAAERPNIVLVMVDDMGFSDIACYGGEIPTPHLDALAAGGIKFSHFYNTGRCCPTRASLLTGLYSHQTGIGHMTTDQGVAGYRGKLSDNCATTAEVLQSAGYFRATWKKQALVFVNSMSDLFHENVPLEFIQRVFAVMADCSHLTFQVLTKRAEMLAKLADNLPWPRNVWMGVSVEDHRVAHRIDFLRQVPSSVRFLSCEPLIGVRLEH